MRNLKILMILVLPLLISGCIVSTSSTSSIPSYVYAIVLDKPISSEKLEFTDDFISIKFYIELNGTTLGFELENKTEKSIRINWDEISMVSPDGRTLRIMHSGVRFIEKDKPQAPTVVPPKAKLKDVLIPTENVYYDEGIYMGKFGFVGAGWKTKKLISNIKEDMSFGLYMPLIIGNETKEYYFSFKIIKILIE